MLREGVEAPLIVSVVASDLGVRLRMEICKS
jgi:hypothetical protein